MIGAGNVGTNLVRALCHKHEILQIYSHSAANAKFLADAIGCPNATNDLSTLADDADIYIISIKDDAIADVIASVPDNGALWAHTSGSIPMSVFASNHSRYGVFYPMQSFSKQIETEFSDVPFFIEGNCPESAIALTELAKTISNHVYAADSDTRRRLHIAAVFSCNFANHLWALAHDVLREAGLPFDVMKPLIRTTVEKLDTLSPAESQTGPAMRCDYDVISKHLSMLSGDKHEVYDMLSRSIIKKHFNSNKP